MRMLYYPPQGGDVTDSTIGIGAHTELVLVSVIKRLPIDILMVQLFESYEASLNRRVSQTDMLKLWGVTAVLYHTVATR